MPPRPQPAHYGRFWFDARKVVAIVETAIDKRLRSELQISETMYLLLSAVDVDTGPFNQKQVADLLITTGATVSRQLEAGAASGYLVVTTSPSTRRENVITLTPRGRELVAAGDAIVLEESTRLLGGVDARDFAVAADVMATVSHSTAARQDDGAAS